MPVPADLDFLGLEAKGELAAALARRFHLTCEDDVKAAGDACVRLHNAGAWDIIAFLEGGQLQALQSSDFFLAAHFIEQILPELETDPTRLIACIESLVARGGNDLAAGAPNAAFRAWCCRDEARARSVLRAAQEGDASACRNLTFPLEALGSPEEARRVLKFVNDQCVMAAITALGRIPDADPASRQLTLGLLAERLDGADDEFKAAILHVVAFLFSQDAMPLREAELEVFRRTIADPGNHVIHVAAHVLWVHVGARRPEIMAALFEILRGLDPSSKGTINTLDNALAALLDSDRQETVLRFVQELFSGPGTLELSEFNSFLYKLTNESPDILGHALVKWFLSGELRLCDGIAQSLDLDMGKTPLADLSGQVCDLSSIQQVFLCRKAIGWLFMKSVSAASVLVSILRVCDDETAKVVVQLLVNPMLVSYGEVHEYLEAVNISDPAYHRISQALKENNTYLDALRGIPEIKELHPSESRRSVQRIRMRERSREIAKQARKKSVFFDLVKRSVILYGRRSISFVTDPGGGQRSIVTDLHPHSVSFELPRLDICDPVGLDYALRHFRVERLRT